MWFNAKIYTLLCIQNCICRADASNNPTAFDRNEKFDKNNQKEQPKIDTFTGGSVNRSLTDCIQINRLIVAGIDMHSKNAST